MNKLMIAAATAALCAAATSFAPSAQAGMHFGGGGGRFFHFGFRPHFYTPPSYYSVPDEDDRPVRRRHRSVHIKPEKPAKKIEKVERPRTPLVRFADGVGRQYDPASKVWFDGKSQCYSGNDAFTFRTGHWYYGKSRWTLENSAWKSGADSQPELVSCESVPSFAAKANAVAAKTAVETPKQDSGKATSEQPPKTSAPAKIKSAEAEPAASDKAAVAPPATECKKYFPSVGQMLTVPCGQ